MASLLRNKKGKIELVLFYILYIPLTFIVVFMLTRYFPFMVYGDGASSFDAEKLVYSQRVFSGIAGIDEVTLRRHSHTIDSARVDEKTLKNIFSMSSAVFNERGPVGIRVTIQNAVAYYNPDFFKDAYPLKSRYSTFMDKRPVIIISKDGTQVFGFAEVAGVFNPRFEREEGEE